MFYMSSSTRRLPEDSPRDARAKQRVHLRVEQCTSQCQPSLRGSLQATSDVNKLVRSRLQRASGDKQGSQYQGSQGRAVTKEGLTTKALESEVCREPSRAISVFTGCLLFFGGEPPSREPQVTSEHSGSLRATSDANKLIRRRLPRAKSFMNHLGPSLRSLVACVFSVGRPPEETQTTSEHSGSPRAT